MSTKAKKAPKYTPEYFLNKFSEIPNSKWTTGELRNGDKCCALGFCGVKPLPASIEGDYKYTREARALEAILRIGFSISATGLVNPAEAEVVMGINDGDGAGVGSPLPYSTVQKFGKTPRTRILNALRKAQKVLQKVAR